jgi:hypothetical protein
MNPYKSPTIPSERRHKPRDKSSDNGRLNSATRRLIRVFIGLVVLVGHGAGFSVLLLAIYYPTPMPVFLLALEPIAATALFIVGLIYWRDQSLVASFWGGLWVLMPGVFAVAAYAL